MSTSLDNEQRRYNRMLLSTDISRIIARHSYAGIKHTLVGSRASDIAIQGSDVDVLAEPISFTIDESLLEYNDKFPCYVKIPVTALRGNIPDILRSDEYVRSGPVRDMDEKIFEKNLCQYPGSKVGKIISNTDGSSPADMVPQLRISARPRTAQISHQRDRSWPPERIIALITKGEFHLTPRPAPCNPDPDHDFCLSFAKAEVILTNSMSNNQRRCILWLKHILRCINRKQENNIDKKEENKIITSYHMKTTSFWYFEQASTDIGASNLPIMNILKRLDKYLGEKFLPHYFVSTMDLFAGIKDFDLREARRRLRSFLGFFIISSEPQLSIITSASVVIALSLYDNCRNFERHAETLYNNFAKSEPKFWLLNEEPFYFSVKKKMFPVNWVTNDCGKKIAAIKDLRSTINEMADGWNYGRRITDLNKLHCNIIECSMAITEHEPLEEFFCMCFLKKIQKKGCACTLNAELKIQKPEYIMNKWLRITDDIISSLNSHVNSVTDQLLTGVLSFRSNGSSQVSSDEHDIEKLFCFDHLIRKLLSSVNDAIRELSPVVDSDAHSFIPMGETPVSADTLMLAIQELFIPVEFVIVRSILLHTADVPRKSLINRSRYYSAQVDTPAQDISEDVPIPTAPMLSPSLLERNCLEVIDVITQYVGQCDTLYDRIVFLHGRMEFFGHSMSKQNRIEAR